MMPASSPPRLAAAPGLSLPRSLQPTPTDEARPESFSFTVPAALRGLPSMIAIGPIEALCALIPGASQAESIKS